MKKGSNRSLVFVGLLLAGAVLGLSGCSDEPKPGASRGAPPPPPPKASGCGDDAGTIEDSDLKQVFPRAFGAFCVDKNDPGDSFGENASLPLEQICDLFDGECEVYKGFDVERVVRIRYVHGERGEASVDVHVSRFDRPADAFGMFTMRTVGDGDPADPATPKPLEVDGMAGLGVGNAYLWRGKYLVEAVYNDSTASIPDVEKASAEVLPELIKTVASAFKGQSEPPLAVQALPEAQRLPLGVRWIPKGAFGIDAIGPAARGYYRDGDKRYRVVLMPLGDDAEAKDVLKSIVKAGGTSDDSLGADGVRFVAQAGSLPAVEWLIRREGRWVVGIGDEPRVLRSGMGDDERSKLGLSEDEKKSRLDAVAIPPDAK